MLRRCGMQCGGSWVHGFLAWSSAHARYGALDGAKGGNRLCAVRTDLIALEAQLLHLADRALTQRITEGDGALVSQLVMVDQNFGHRGGDAKGVSQWLCTLRGNFVPTQVQLRARATAKQALSKEACSGDVACSVKGAGFMGSWPGVQRTLVTEPS